MQEAKEPVSPNPEVTKELLDKGKDVFKDFDETQGVVVDPTVSKKMDELIKSSNANLDATKELTKVVSDLVAAWEKWRKAGKF